MPSFLDSLGEGLAEGGGGLLNLLAFLGTLRRGSGGVPGLLAERASVLQDPNVRSMVAGSPFFGRALGLPMTELGASPNPEAAALPGAQYGQRVPQLPALGVKPQIEQMQQAALHRWLTGRATDQDWSLLQPIGLTPPADVLSRQMAPYRAAGFSPSSVRGPGGMTLTAPKPVLRSVGGEVIEYQMNPATGHYEPTSTPGAGGGGGGLNIRDFLAPPTSTPAASRETSPPSQPAAAPVPTALPPGFVPLDQIPDAPPEPATPAGAPGATTPRPAEAAPGPLSFLRQGPLRAVGRLLGPSEAAAAEQPPADLGAPGTEGAILSPTQGGARLPPGWRPGQPPVQVAQDAPVPTSPAASPQLRPGMSVTFGRRGEIKGGTLRGPAQPKAASDFSTQAATKALRILVGAKGAIQRLRDKGVLTDNPVTGSLGQNRVQLEIAARQTKDRQTREDSVYLLRVLQSAVPTLARGFGEQRTNIQEEKRLRDALSFSFVPADTAEAVIDNYIQLFSQTPGGTAGGTAAPAPTGAAPQGRFLGFTPDR